MTWALSLFALSSLLSHLSQASGTRRHPGFLLLEQRGCWQVGSGREKGSNVYWASALCQVLAWMLFKPWDIFDTFSYSTSNPVLLASPSNCVMSLTTFQHLHQYLYLLPHHFLLHSWNGLFSATPAPHILISTQQPEGPFWNTLQISLHCPKPTVVSYFMQKAQGPTCSNLDHCHCPRCLSTSRPGLPAVPQTSWENLPFGPVPRFPLCLECCAPCLLTLSRSLFWGHLIAEVFSGLAFPWPCFICHCSTYHDLPRKISICFFFRS